MARYIQKVALHKNMWVHLKYDTSAEIFAELLLKIGDGHLSTLKCVVTIPSNLNVVINF